MSEYWQKQTPDKPLFPDLLWSRPENKTAKGKLLIIGGHSQSFNAPALAYGESLNAGVGTARVLLPASIKKLLPTSFYEMEFAPATPSGSFSRQALAEVLDVASWADAVLLAGDFGKNSETAVLLESFLDKYHGPLALSQDTTDYFVNSATICKRKNTLVSVDLNQLQKLSTAINLPVAITSKMDFLHFVEALHQFSYACSLSVMINHLGTSFVSSAGQVSTTKPLVEADTASLAAHGIVWWLQNPSKEFEALTTSLLGNAKES